MNNKSTEDNSRTGFIIAFIVVAILSIICCLFVNSLLKKNDNKGGANDTSSSVTAEVMTESTSSESASSEVTEGADSTEILTEDLVSNLNEEYYFSGADISYTGNKTFPFPFARVFTPGDVFDKVVVTYSAGASLINELKGGFGFNVTGDGIADSQNRSDSDEWFQGEDFHVTPGTNEFTYEYTIPETVRSKIDFSGECQSGYWYGQLDTLSITKIAFIKIPVLKKIQYNKKTTIDGSANNLFTTNDPESVLALQLKEFSIQEDNQIQCISLEVHGDNPINSLSGSFNISECPDISIDRFSMSEPDNCAVVNFFINSDIAKEIDTQNNTILISLYNETNEKLIVDSVTAYYLTPGALEKLSS